MRRILAVAVSFVVAVSAFGQTVGHLKTQSDDIQFTPSAGYTLVNLDHPALIQTTVDTAVVHWVGGSCTNAYKLKFFRLGIGTGVYSQIAERGPFAVSVGLSGASFDPVALNRGDLVGVEMLRSDCGAPMSSKANPGVLSAVGFAGDATSFDLKTATVFRGTMVNVRAHPLNNPYVGTIPVVGSAAGANGASFRTTVQLTNPRTGELLRGALVFHPAGQPGSTTDVTIPFNLQGGETKIYPDILTAFNRTGLGSIDVLGSNGPHPTIATRIFNDQGAAGTSGFNEELIEPDEFLTATEQYDFAIPSDLTNFRQNVGIRTLDEGATIDFFSLNGINNGVLGFTTRVYPPNYFEQVSVASIFGAGNFIANGAIRIRVTAGRAAAYVSTTDNRTNDSNAQFSKRE